MSIRNVTKALAGMEDLLAGRGQTTQTRNGNTVTVSGVDLAFAVDSVVQMQALDVAKYSRARVYASANNYTTYAYDPADNTGISSDTGPGTWLVVPESESVVVALAKADLVNEEPAYNYQAAFAYGGSSLTTGAGAMYYYSPGSSATHDGDAVIVTTGGARWIKWLGASAQLLGATHVAAAGGTNNLEITLGVTALPVNQVIYITAANTNTGAATLKVDALSAIPLQRVDGTALTAGYLEAGKVYAVLVQATEASVLNPSASQLLAEAGVDNFAMMTPLRTSQFVTKKAVTDSLGAGLPSDDTSIVTPKLLYKIFGDAQLDFGMDMVATKTELRVEPGIAVDSTNTTSMVLNSLISKQLHDPWTAGDGGGARPVGVTYGDCEWLYVFVIAKPDGTTDIGLDNNVNATNLLVTATGYTLYKWIGIWINAVDNVIGTIGGFDGDGNYAKHRRDKHIKRIRLSIAVTVPFLWPPEHTSATVDLIGGGSDTSNAGDTSIVMGTAASPVTFTAYGGSASGAAGSFDTSIAFPGFRHGPIFGRKGKAGNGSTQGGYAMRSAKVNSISESAPGNFVDGWGTGGISGGGGGGFFRFTYPIEEGGDSSLVVGAKGGTGQDAATDPVDTAQLGGWPGNIVIEL